MKTSAKSTVDESVVEEIVARVNNSVITRGDLRREREKIQQDMQQQNVPNIEQAMAEGEKNLIRNLIDQQLLVQKGSDLNVNVDAELIKRLDAMRKDMGLNSMEELEKAATDQGVLFEDYKQSMKNDMITSRVISQEIGGRIQITREDVKNYYEAHKTGWNLPEEVSLSEILIPQVPASADPKVKAPDATPEQEAAAQAKVNEVLAKLKSGAKFDELAKQYSAGETASRGGELGIFKRGELAKELEDKTFALKDGEIAEPMLTRQGWLILKVVRHVAAGIPAMETITPQIQDAIYQERIQPAMREYLTKLREDAYIDIHEGYVDTGASPNQTKPVMATDDAKSGKGKANKVHTLSNKKRHKHFLIF